MVKDIKETNKSTTATTNTKKTYVLKNKIYTGIAVVEGTVPYLRGWRS